MNKMTKVALITALGAMAVTQSANAALTFTLNKSINGTAPTSTSPWLTAVFENIVNAQNVTTGVKLTLTSSLEVSSEFISSVAFNVNPTIDPANINYVNNTPENPAATLTKAHQNERDLNGAGDLGKEFDIRIDWATASSDGGVKRFNLTDVEQYSFTFNGLSESDFNYTNPSGYHIAAHVQGIPTTGGTTSGAIADGPPSSAAVPEPSTYLAAALLALPVLSHVRRMRKAA